VAALSALPADGQTLTQKEIAKAHPRIAARLRHRIDRKAAERAKAGKAPLSAESQRIRVMFQLREGTAFDPAVITGAGGRVLRHRTDLVAAELPFDRIEGVIDASPAVALARLPHRLRPLEEIRDTSEGVPLIAATAFHANGFRGAGVRIAVVDLGFMGLSDAQARGDLPMDLYTHDFTGQGLERHLKHGTGCAEIVHDVAPDAELHLLRIADEQDLFDAFDYCRAHGIDIVSLSIGTSGVGPGNGTGPFEALCEEARAGGILVVAAAGNDGNFSKWTTVDGVYQQVWLGTHWEGVFTYSGYPNFPLNHGFSLNYPFNLLLAFPDRDDEGVPYDDEVSIILRWDDWPASSIDYDMYLSLYDGVSSYVPVAASTGRQTGTQEPMEEIVLDVPDSVVQQYYMLEIRRMPDAPVGRKLEIFLAGRSYFLGVSGFPLMATSTGSIGEPADSANVLAVGAIDHAKWNSNTVIEEYSSQGPTNDWAGRPARIKPDISGPDAVTTFAYAKYQPGDLSPFSGTSAAAPHVAGAAALVKSFHPNKTPAELQAFLESWAMDQGAAGKDNVFGAGKLRLALSNSPPVFAAIGSKTVSEGQLLAFTVHATDADRDTLAYEALDLPAGARFNPATRTFSWRPSYCQSGSYPVNFRAADGTQLEPYDEGYGSAFITVTEAPPRGDLDASCAVELTDAVLALQLLAGFDLSASLRPGYAASGADVDGDATVGFAELLFIMQLLADLR
jgi:subtilisin family serine protease